MKNISRLTVAAVLVGLLIVVATGVWAAPVFKGTVPNPPASGNGGTTVETGGTTEVTPVDMGTAVFTPDCTGCTIEVTLVEDAAALAAALEGKAFLGDTFELKINGTGSAKVSFALPPEFADKDAKIYKLDTSVTPAVWVEVPGAVVNADGTISVDVTEGGVYTLMGNQ